MNKKRYFTICGIIAAAGLIIAGIGFAFGGRFYGIEFSKKGPRICSNVRLPGMNDYEEKEEALDAFDSLDIDCTFSDVNVIKSDHYGISYYVSKSNVPQYKVSDGELKLEQPKGIIREKGRYRFRFHFDIDDIEEDYINIYVPENFAGKSLKIKTSSGDVSLDAMNFKKVKLENDFGDVNFDSIECETFDADLSSGSVDINQLKGNSIKAVTKFGNLDIKTIQASESKLESESGTIDVDKIVGNRLDVKSKFGSIELKKADVSEKVDVECESGDVALGGIVAKDVQVESKFGSVEIGIDNMEDYSYDCTARLGEISVDGRGVAGSYMEKNPNAAKNVKITSESGEVEIYED